MIPKVDGRWHVVDGVYPPTTYDLLPGFKLGSVGGRWHVVDGVYPPTTYDLPPTLELTNPNSILSLQTSKRASHTSARPRPETAPRRK